jgi:cephalosporin hydroxylase
MPGVATGTQPTRTVEKSLWRRRVEWHALRSPTIQRLITRAFHRLYYGVPERTWEDTRWLGSKTLKCPLDMWIYQELIAAVRPELIVETGTHSGGSAHFMATICDAIGTGRIITIDTEERQGRPEHSRITYVHGSSTDPEIVASVAAAAGDGPTLVILDSDHRRDHVLAELEAYAPVVDVGSYLIVEDTNVNGHPAAPRFGPGPTEAIAEFLPRHPEFERDRNCERYFMTFNPGGYLRRTQAAPAPDAGSERVADVSRPPEPAHR